MLGSARGFIRYNKNHLFNAQTKLKIVFTSLFIGMSLIIFRCYMNLFFGASKLEQKYIRDITVSIKSKETSNIIDILKRSGFRRIHAIFFDSAINNKIFDTVKKKAGRIDESFVSMINTSYVLFSSSKVFDIPFLPKLPDKQMVIGYSFEQCYNAGFALLLPDKLDGLLVKKSALKRFAEFMKDTLDSSYSDDESFRIFTDLHSLRVVVFPCNGFKLEFPKWESFDVIENNNTSPFRPWGHISKIPEVWKVYE